MQKVQLILGAILVFSTAPTIADQCRAEVVYLNEAGTFESLDSVWLVDCGHAICSSPDLINQTKVSKLHRSQLNARLEETIELALDTAWKDELTDDLLKEINNTRTNKYLAVCMGFQSDNSLNELIED